MSKEITATKVWLEEIIIGLNFCPFAKKEFVNQSINYHVSRCVKIVDALEEMIQQCEKLTAEPSIETSLIIFKQGFVNFDQYLDLLDYANNLLIDCGYEGVYQVASFHPQYCFEGENSEDAANYTNRSPYPMLHLLREASLEKVLAIYPEPENIPDNNIALAREKGAEFFKNKLRQYKQMQP